MDSDPVHQDLKSIKVGLAMHSSLSGDIHFVTNYPLKYKRVIDIFLINGNIISYFVFLSNCHECW